MCTINHWLDNWECFMNARSASQGLGPSVWSPVHQEGESHEGLWPFPFCNKCKNAADLSEIILLCHDVSFS